MRANAVPHAVRMGGSTAEREPHRSSWREGGTTQRLSAMCSERNQHYEGKSEVLNKLRFFYGR